MKILFTGLPYFGKQLVADLNAFDPSNRYVFCNTYYSKTDQLKFLWHLLSAKKVVSFNGVTSESRALNWALRFKKPLIMQWHGSDVLTAQENHRTGKFTRKYIDAATSYTDAPWLKNELTGLKIDAGILAFKHVSVKNAGAAFPTSDVLAYIAQNDELFYGIDHVISLAKEFPDMQFHVVGTDGKKFGQLPNVQFYGWVSEEKFGALLNTCPVFLRLPKHDGYSLSVLRAIANGNYVIWNYPHPASVLVEDSKEISEKFWEVVLQLRQNNGARNKFGMDWAKEHLDRKKILQAYVQVLLK